MTKRQMIKRIASGIAGFTVFGYKIKGRMVYDYTDTDCTINGNDFSFAIFKRKVPCINFTQKLANEWLNGGNV